MNKFFYGILVLLILTSCAQKLNGLKAYNELQNRETVDAFRGNTTQTIPVLKVNEEYKFSLKTEDPILVYKTDSLIRSNFKQFKVLTKPDSRYRISIYSICNCMGFKKQVFVPQLHICDEKGNIYKPVLIEEKIDYPKGSKAKAISVMQEYGLKNPLPATLYLTVFADNENLDKRVDRLNVSGISGFIPYTIPLSLKSTTNGEFVIQVKEYSK